ncbi:monofunctional biosynthetic peptidoglycan transglycosylase [Nereida sp. MMG025]|uniref:monofunctional biosynthetic peptidoglycan transglycosylase n=1 Tax=Nereida sp. MMG025 TaxID=2909981 RepID=UPI001F0313B9|nr:monofunctional biosynthetic peptidoglycan transglycosylase [Nereida sp. MMG025]MCF6444535.1 monofunctional biosynthetic peptidoglycan transglycosylase [Nereida sp. MMG025]
MAKKAVKSKSKAKSKDRKPPVLVRPILWVRKWVLRAVLAVVALTLLWIASYAVINPPTTPYIVSEGVRLGDIDREWVPIEEIAPVMARSVVAAEDANFCLHWGLDLDAIVEAAEDGNRGGSTISQQVVKNVFLWHGRSWLRKGLEAVMTPVVELIWSKRRIVEVYLNMVEFDEGIFGVEAASQHYFGVAPDALTSTQAARLAAVLPAPKSRSASRPSEFVRNRAASIAGGAATIQADGRAACFQS